MVFLHSHEVSTARAVRIFKTYGADAIQVMTDNPYRLARDIRGIGFTTADAIAMKLGFEKTAMVRVRAGISYALTEAMEEGQCGLPTEELMPLAETLLEVPQQLIGTALELELQDGTVIADRVGEAPCVFLAGLYRAERAISDRLMRLANGMLPWPSIDSDKALPWVEKHVGFALAESQIAAIRLALTSKVLVMTGCPASAKPPSSRRSCASSPRRAQFAALRQGLLERVFGVARSPLRLSGRWSAHLVFDYAACAAVGAACHSCLLIAETSTSTGMTCISPAVPRVPNTELSFLVSLNELKEC